MLVDQRVYRVQAEDLAPIYGQPDPTPATAAVRIARRFGAGAGWWPQLRDANPQKAVAPNGYWYDVREGETLAVPASWPMLPGETVHENMWETPRQAQDAAGPADDIASATHSALEGAVGQPWSQVPGQPSPGSDDEPWWVRLYRVLGDNPDGSDAGAPRGERIIRLLREPVPARRERRPPTLLVPEIARRERRPPTLLVPEIARHEQPPAIPVARRVADRRGEWWLEAGDPLDDSEEQATQSQAAGWQGSVSGRQNTTSRTYSVVAGDGMFRIAQKLGAASRPHWFAELRDANPTKEVAEENGKQIGWVSLNPGEIINIPDAWPESPQLRPAPGGMPTPAPTPGLNQFPPLSNGGAPAPTAPPGTIPAGATVDPGTLLRVQGILALWTRQNPGAANPKDFGQALPFSPDLTGVLNLRTKQATASFQTWHNAQGFQPTLRTDGVLEPQTITALDQYGAGALGGAASGQVPSGLPGLPAGMPPALPSGLPSVPGLPQFKEQRPGDANPWDEVLRGAAGAASTLLGGLTHAPPNAPAGTPPPIAGAVAQLPNVLPQLGVPGVPGLPGGAPHAPQVPVVVPPEVQQVLPPEVPVAVAAPAPAPKKKSDAGALGLILTGLSLFSGILS